MKKVIKEAKRENSLQAVVNYLIDNGLTEFDTNILIHTNLPALGGERSILRCIQDEEWDDAWSAAELYISGDMW